MPPSPHEISRLEAKIFRRPLILFLLAFGISAALSLSVIFVGPMFGFKANFGGSIHDGYLEIGRNLIAGNGFGFEPGGPPELHRPPVYPLFLAPLTLLPQPLQRPVLVLVQALLFGGIVVLAYKNALRFFGYPAAKWSVLLLMANPWNYFIIKNPMNVVLQGLLYILLVSLVANRIQRREQGPETAPAKNQLIAEAVKIGIVAGLLSLIHGTMLPTALAIILAPYVLTYRRHKGCKGLAPLAASVLVMLLLIAPWTYRNWEVNKRLVPVSGGAGFGYFMGKAHWDYNTKDLPTTALRYAGLYSKENLAKVQYLGIIDPALEERVTKSMAQDIKRDPAGLLRKVGLNLIEFYFPIVHNLGALKVSQQWAQKDAAVKTVTSLYFGALWVLALIGLWRCFAARRRVRPAVFYLLVIIINLVWYLPFLAFIIYSQYAFSTLPFLATLAALGLLGRKAAPGPA